MVESVLRFSNVAFAGSMHLIYQLLNDDKQICNWRQQKKLIC